RFGWLIRDLHVWAASLIIIAVLAHMGRVFFEAAYKPPRETNWTMGLILLGLVLLFGATGYLLPWDQWAYWTVTEVLDAVAAVPLVGAPLADAVKGDVIASGATLSRFFAIHVIVLPWATGAVVAYHFTLVRRRKLAPPVDQPEEQRHWRVSVAVGPNDAAEPEPAEGIPFYPNHLLRSFMVASTTVAIVFTLAILFPRPIGNPADPGVVPGELVSTWVPVDVSIALIRLIGPLGFALFTLMGLSLAFLPLFDRAPERRWRKRPVATALGVAFFTGFVALWIVGRAIGSVPPTGRTAPPESRLEALPLVEEPGPSEGSPAPFGGGQ
ncbi:MAG: cytochrome b N-terminal domain-containing protein, partial [Gemmatimonadota bacterium]|nr:cytochrome b N-terminal domain-containing protein [Gemmatimonadota bacterium]